MAPLEGQISIKILGRSFTFQTQGNVDKAREAAELVAAKVATAEKNLGRTVSEADKIGLFFLAALDVANSFLELKDDHQNFLEKVGFRSERLISRICDDKADENDRAGPIAQLEP